jgi:hypothetical protein
MIPATKMVRSPVEPATIRGELKGKIDRLAALDRQRQELALADLEGDPHARRVRTQLADERKVVEQECHDLEAALPAALARAEEERKRQFREAVDALTAEFDLEIGHVNEFAATVLSKMPTKDEIFDAYRHARTIARFASEFEAVTGDRRRVPDPLRDLRDAAEELIRFINTRVTAAGHKPELRELPQRPLLQRARSLAAKSEEG